MANIPMYSAMKKVAYLKPEYSFIWPATISDSPSGTSNGVRFDSTRPDTKYKKDAPVDCKRRHVPAIRNDPKGENGRSSNENWCQEVQKLVRAHGDDVFLYQHLDTVGYGLQKPEWPNAIGAVAILYPAKNLPLQHRHERKQREEYE